VTGANIPVPSIENTQVEVIPESKKPIIERATTTEAYVRNYFSDIPVLAEVARCESTFRQTDKSGNIIRGKANRFDVGVMQINEHYHLERAKKIGLDIYTLEGNMAYARELYEDSGTKPWMASSPCWSGSGQEALAENK